MTFWRPASLVKESDFKLKRPGKLDLLWICVVVGAFTGTAWHLHVIIKTYFEYGYYESIINKKSVLEFPDITICVSPSDHQVSKNADKFANIMMSGFKIIQYIVNNNISLDPELISSADTIYANLHPNERGIFGAELNEVVVHCTFHGRPCFHFGNFVTFHHDQSYNCYTFRYNNTANRTVSSGPYSGLSLILKETNPLKSTYDTTQPTANTEGLKIVIHTRDTIPFLMDKGISVHPGKSTDIGIAMKKYERLDQPYDECATEEWVTDIYDNTYKMNEKLCEQTAKFNEIFHTCSCYSVRYFPHKYKHHQDYERNCKYINLRNLSESVARMSCQTKMFEKYDLGTPNNCAWPCRETDYDMIMSQTVWPQQFMIPDFIEKFILTLSDASPIKQYYYKIKHEYNPGKKPRNSSNDRELK